MPPRADFKIACVLPHHNPQRPFLATSSFAHQAHRHLTSLKGFAHRKTDKAPHRLHATFEAQHRADRFHCQQNTLPSPAPLPTMPTGISQPPRPPQSLRATYQTTMGNSALGEPTPAQFSKCSALPTSARLNQPAMILPAGLTPQNRSALPFPPAPQPSKRLCFRFLVPNEGVSGTACLSRTMAGDATLP